MFLSLLHEALISIAAARLRTFLAMLGIVIGVGSVVLMLAIGTGSRKQIEDAIAKLGSNLLVVTPGGNSRGGGRGGDGTLNLNDARAIGQLSTINLAAPTTRMQTEKVIAGRRNGSFPIYGVTSEFFDVRSWPIQEGENFTETELSQAARVAIIGSTVAGRLFGGTNPVGAMLRIKGLPFKVIGVLESKGQGYDGKDQDNVMFIPFSTFQHKLGGRNLINDNVSVIFVQSISKELMDESTEEITELLRQRYKLTDYDKDNFTIRNLTAISNTATETSRALAMLLSSIASISLIVGGIGIMNIMLVTVTERTREIGIRKAIGASEFSIMLQFLLEAVMIAGIGSVIGLLTGCGGAWAANKYMGLPISISVWSVVASLTVAGVVGVISGIYPAQRASALQPIDALRQVGG